MNKVLEHYPLHTKQTSKLSSNPMTEASKIGIGLPNIIFAHSRWASTLFSALIEIMTPFLKYKEGAIPDKKKTIKRTALTEKEKVRWKKRYEEKRQRKFQRA